MDDHMTTGPTCGRCGANLISGYLEGSNDADPPERVCPECNPDHPFSVGVRESMAKRDPAVVDKMTIQIYGRALPELKVWDAVKRFVHETFDPDWSVDLRMEAEPIRSTAGGPYCGVCGAPIDVVPTPAQPGDSTTAHGSCPNGCVSP